MGQVANRSGRRLPHCRAPNMRLIFVQISCKFVRLNRLIKLRGAAFAVLELRGRRPPWLWSCGGERPCCPRGSYTTAPAQNLHNSKLSCLNCLTPIVNWQHCDCAAPVIGVKYQ